MKIRDFFKISIIKTIYFNQKYFDFKTAVKFPVILGRKVKFISVKGTIKLNIEPSFGTIFIKDNEININGIWIINGKVRLKGGTDSLIFISEKGVLETGKNFFSNGPVAINCMKNIKLGDNCLLAHKIEISDTDFHKIMNKELQIINDDKSVVIGDRVWIGSNTIILKGTRIASDVIIGAGSLLTKQYNENNSVYAGVPAKLVKSGITWDY